MGRSVHHELDRLHTALGSRSLDSLTAHAWSTYARQRRIEGAGPATVLHTLATARALLNAARPMFGLDVDGASVKEAVDALALTGHVARARQRDRRPTEDELQRLRRESERVFAYPSALVPMHIIVPLAIALPRRLGELCRARWEDYNGSLIVLRDTKHPRLVRNETVPVPPAARAILDALPRIDERVLPYKTDSVSAAFERACARLRIDDLRFHDLRHEGICRLFEAGYAIPEVAMVSGHLSWSTLKRYTHLRPQDVSEKMNARSQVGPSAAQPA